MDMTCPPKTGPVEPSPVREGSRTLLAGVAVYVVEPFSLTELAARVRLAMLKLETPDTVRSIGPGRPDPRLRRTPTGGHRPALDHSILTACTTNNTFDTLAICRDKRERGVSVVSQRTSAAPTNIRGVDQSLWRWLKAQAALEGKTIGEKLNEILACYKCQTETS